MARLHSDEMRALAALDVLGCRLDAHDDRRKLMTPADYRKAAEQARALYQIVGSTAEGLEIIDRSNALWDLLTPTPGAEAAALLKRVSAPSL